MATRIFKAERGRNFTRASLIHNRLNNSSFRFFTDKELDKLSDKEQLMLSRGSVKLRMCGNCKLGFLVPSLTILKFQHSNLSIFGYLYRCGYCAGESKNNSKFNEERKKYIEKGKWLAEVLKRQN